MTLAVPLRSTGASRLLQLIRVARAACFVVAVGVFLSAPPVLPWVLVVVAATNVLHLVAKASLSEMRPPFALLVLNGVTVLLVVLFSAVQ